MDTRAARRAEITSTLADWLRDQELIGLEGHLGTQAVLTSTHRFGVLGWAVDEPEIQKLRAELASISIRLVAIPEPSEVEWEPGAHYVYVYPLDGVGPGEYLQAHLGDFSNEEIAEQLVDHARALPKPFSLTLHRVEQVNGAGGIAVETELIEATRAGWTRL